MSPRASYPASHPYDLVNPLTDDTKRVWICIHGLGFLSRYFARLFKTLDPGKNHLVVPQAPSKFYLRGALGDFTHVGASWLTREDTVNELPNVLNYLDGILANEAHKWKGKEIVLLGFSQGVSIATRWWAHRNVNIDRLVLWAGRIPEELVDAPLQNSDRTVDDADGDSARSLVNGYHKVDQDHRAASPNNAEAAIAMAATRKQPYTKAQHLRSLHLVYGIHDEYVNEKRMDAEYRKAKSLFGDKIVVQSFDGPHTITSDALETLINSWDV